MFGHPILHVSRYEVRGMKWPGRWGLSQTSTRFTTAASDLASLGGSSKRQSGRKRKRWTEEDGRMKDLPMLKLKVLHISLNHPGWLKTKRVFELTLDDSFLVVFALISPCSSIVGHTLHCKWWWCYGWNKAWPYGLQPESLVARPNWALMLQPRWTASASERMTWVMSFNDYVYAELEVSIEISLSLLWWWWWWWWWRWWRPRQRPCCSWWWWWFHKRTAMMFFCCARCFALWTLALSLRAAVRQAMCGAVYDATQLVCHTLPQHSTFSTLQVFPWEVVKNGEDCGGCAGSENGQLNLMCKNCSKTETYWNMGSNLDIILSSPLSGFQT